VLGHALLLGAAASWALAMVALRARPPRVKMLDLLPWAFLMALPVLAVAALLFSPPPLAAPRSGALLALLLVGAVAGPVGTWCVIAASIALPAMVSATGFLAIPVLGLALGTLWLAEPFGPELLLGGALVLAGAALAARR
jgi:drug/metabolite transporter (DMT)-like permease